MSKRNSVDNSKLKHKRSDSSKSSTEESEQSDSPETDSSAESYASKQEESSRKIIKKQSKKHKMSHLGDSSDSYEKSKETLKNKSKKQKHSKRRRQRSSSSSSSESDQEDSEDSAHKKRKKHKHKKYSKHKKILSDRELSVVSITDVSKLVERKNVDGGKHLKLDKEQPKSKWDSPAEQETRSRDRVKTSEVERNTHFEKDGDRPFRASSKDRSRAREEIPSAYRIWSTNEGANSENREQYRSKETRDVRDNRNKYRDNTQKRDSREQHPRENENRNARGNFEIKSNGDQSRDRERNRDNYKTNQDYRENYRDDNRDHRDNRNKTYDRQDNSRRWNNRSETLRAQGNRASKERNWGRFNEENKQDKSYERRTSGRRSRSAERRVRSKSPANNRPINPLRREKDSESHTWGKDEPNPGNSKQSGDKDKPNFGLSGKLTEETNTYKGVIIKYSEPQESRKPKRRWRLYPFKGENVMATLYIHRQSCYLIGRDRKVVDIPVDHPSCSKQHAALQYRLVNFTRDNGSQGKRVRPYLIDLESSNGTYVNNNKIEAKKYVELLERDVIKFGFSSREYVLLHENSKDEAQDDDVTGEELDVKPAIKKEPKN